MSEIFTSDTREQEFAEKALLKMFGAAIFALLTILASQIRIPLPFTPVPMTLQTFIVPVAGVLGLAWGGVSMMIYLVLGMAGLHVFASGASGLAFLVTPTAGYVFGFIFAAMIVGFARDKFPKSYLALFLSVIASHVVIFVCGVAGLVLNGGMTLAMGIEKGVLPFLIGDIFKITASYLVLASVQFFSSDLK